MTIDLVGPWGNGRARNVYLNFGADFLVTGHIVAFAGGCENAHPNDRTCQHVVMYNLTQYFFTSTHQSPIIYQMFIGLVYLSASGEFQISNWLYVSWTSLLVSKKISAPSASFPNKQTLSNGAILLGIAAAFAMFLFNYYATSYKQSLKKDT